MTEDQVNNDKEEHTGAERAAGISREARENQMTLYAITTRPATVPYFIKQLLLT